MPRLRLFPFLPLLFTLTLIAAATAPAKAGELDADTWLGERAAMLHVDDPAQRFLAGVAACMWLAGDAPRIARHVEAFGWQRGEYGGIVELVRGDSRLLVSTEGGFCDIAVSGVRLTEARRLLAAFVAEVATYDDEAPHLWSLSPGPGECATGRFPGGRFKLQSDGQDPVCEGPVGASVRVGFGT